MTRYLLIACLLFPLGVAANESEGVSGAVQSGATSSGAQSSEKTAEELFQAGMTRARLGDFYGGIQVLREAGEKGHVGAMLIASSMLIDGSFLEEGVALLDQAVATGDPRARLEMAKLIFAEAAVLQHSVAEAKALLGQLVDEEYLPALHVRADMAASGGVYPQDLPSALELYKKAAHQGFEPSMISLHDIYDEGRFGLAVDLDEALKWQKMREETTSK